MIVGIGVDTLAIERVERELRHDPEAFAALLFTPAELARCDRPGSLARHCAELFAAKEALFKALAVGPLDTGAYREVEVLQPSSAAAGFRLNGRLLRHAMARGAGRMHLTLTSNRDVVAAYVVVESAADAAAPPRGSLP